MVLWQVFFCVVVVVFVWFRLGFVVALGFFVVFVVGFFVLLGVWLVVVFFFSSSCAHKQQGKLYFKDGKGVKD